jgi:hypothetical protein
LTKFYYNNIINITAPTIDNIDNLMESTELPCDNELSGDKGGETITGGGDSITGGGDGGGGDGDGGGDGNIGKIGVSTPV